LARARNYAVLISAEQTTADDASINCEFWYDLLLQYTTLLDAGYEHDDIYVLFGYGSDFNSRHACYRVPYRVTDYPVSRANIQHVLSELSTIMTPDDFIYVWWTGHGSPAGNHLMMHIGTTGETMYDYEFANWMAPIDHAARAFSWATCYSGGILDDLEGPSSIVMSTATFYQLTYTRWQCDSYHIEFHYPETCAWHWETPCGMCGAVNADSDASGRVSFQEAFRYAYDRTTRSTPQMSDLGGLAPDTYLFREEDVPGDVDGDGDVDLSDLAALLPAYGTCEGDPPYNPAADFDGDGCVDLADLSTLLANYGYGT